MNWFIKLFPEGWVIEPETNLYRFLKVVSNRLDEVSQWIENKKNIIPNSDDPDLSRWERMTGIEVIEQEEARVENIRNKLIGSWGHFTAGLVKKIIEFHTGKEDNVRCGVARTGKALVSEYPILYTGKEESVDVFYHVPLRCGVARAGQRLVPEYSIFYLRVNIKNNLVDKTVREAISQHLNKLKHAHLKLDITYKGVTA